MQKRVAWVVSFVIVGTLVAVYYAWRWLAAPQIAAPPLLPTPPQLAAPAPAPPAAAALPEIRHPIERLPAMADAKSPLPALDGSDGEFGDAIARLIGHVPFGQFVRPEGLVRHIVVTVDNLPRKTFAAKLSPLTPVGGAFIPPANAAQPTLAAADVSRYTPYVAAFQTLDTHKLVGIYTYFYPLFQQAYRELGYPNGYFNDRLVEAIDVMLATPEPGGPVELVQPRVLYQYADADYEALPSGQKILLRMGPENAARVKAKLREIRNAVTGRGAAGAPPHAALSGPSAPVRSSKTTSGE